MRASTKDILMGQEWKEPAAGNLAAQSDRPTSRVLPSYDSDTARYVGGPDTARYVGGHGSVWTDGMWADTARADTARYGHGSVCGRAGERTRLDMWAGRRADMARYVGGPESGHGSVCGRAGERTRLGMRAGGRTRLGMWAGGGPEGGHDSVCGRAGGRTRLGMWAGRRADTARYVGGPEGGHGMWAGRRADTWKDVAKRGIIGGVVRRDGRCGGVRCLKPRLRKVLRGCGPLAGN